MSGLPERKRTKPLKRWSLALVGVVFVAAIGIAVLHVSGYISEKHPHIATMGEITKEMTHLKQHNGYIAGGVYLAELDRRGVPFDAESLETYCIRLRLFVDFASMFTPEQFDTMKRKGGLPITSLSADQARAWVRLRKQFTTSKGSDVAHSTFAFRYVPYWYFMEWRVPMADGSVRQGAYPLTDDYYVISESIKHSRKAKASRYPR